jgi:hypothetical protein
MLKVALKHVKRAKMDPNNLLGRFLDVFVILTTKKSTKTNIFATSSVKNSVKNSPFRRKSRGDPHRGDPPPFVSPT